MNRDHLDPTVHASIVTIFPAETPTSFPKSHTWGLSKIRTWSPKKTLMKMSSHIWTEGKATVSMETSQVFPRAWCLRWQYSWDPSQRLAEPLWSGASLRSGVHRKGSLESSCQASRNFSIFKHLVACWFECKMSSIRSCVWTLHPWLVLLLWKTWKLEPRWRMLVAGTGPCEL